MSKQFELLSKDYISGTKDKRQYVLIHLGLIYTYTYNIAYSDDSDAVNKALNELYGVSKKLLDAGYGIVETSDEEEPDEPESPFTLCEDSKGEPEDNLEFRNIHIKKPKQNGIDADEHISFSPDFANYLRKIDKSFLLTLTAFEKWYEKEHAEEVIMEEGEPFDYTELYRSELQDALEDYENETFKRIYCKPKNIPMPGMQTGHRLLKLPIKINKKQDFNEFYDIAENDITSKIYQGPLGTVEPPDIEYEELIRRYVNALYLKPTTVYNLEDITENNIDVYFETKSDLINPEKINLFIEATKLAVKSGVIAEYIKERQDQGNDLTTDQLMEWMLNFNNEDANAFKNEILNKWADSLAAVLPGTAIGFIEELPDVSHFHKSLLGLCAPLLPKGTILFSNEHSASPAQAPLGAAQAYYSPKAGAQSEWNISKISAITRAEKDEPTTFVTAVIERIDAIVKPYDSVWRVVKDLIGELELWHLKNEIKYSGYEIKNIITWLALAVLNSLHEKGDSYNGARTAGEDIEAHPFTSADTFSLLESKINEEWQLLISSEDILEILGTDSFTQTFSSQGKDLISYAYKIEKDSFPNELVYRVEFTDLISEIVNSYKVLIDALLSFQSASRIRSNVPDEIDNEQILKLYGNWVTFFIDFIKQYSSKRTIARQKRYYLRLVPRMGKYGEIPNPENSATLNLNQLLPSHPRIQTENYMLEPMPQRYACNPFPTLYLRQDLSLTINHLGFGIGSNLYSMSLLPEEEQVITVKSFKDTKISSSESTAENIFEEAGSETSKDFGREMQQESERESKSQSEFSISGKASASFGFGSASVESGYSSKSDSRSLAKSTSACTNRLASKLSAKRNVSIDTQRTVNKEVDIHSELATERKVKNPNKGHTLTFHWFQMTRKLSTELRLNDLKLVYTSGVHNRVAVFGNGTKPEDVEENSFYVLPPDIGNKLPPDSVIAIHTEPYTESISMANANVFLARVFKPEKALETSSFLWRMLGDGDAAPEGYGIAAFCGPTQYTATNNQKYISVLDYKVNDEITEEDTAYVPADELTIQNGNGGTTNYLPNIDLRYKKADGLTPTRYSADEFNGYSLPLVLLREQQVINTNGVYCDAMVGRCTALEDYLQRHRDLDLLEKKLEVGNKELDFKWALEKDGLDVIVTENDETITAIVKEQEEGKGFDARKGLEAMKMDEDKAIAEAKMKMQQLQKELDLLSAKINQANQAPNYKLDVPNGTDLTITAEIDTSAPPTRTDDDE